MTPQPTTARDRLRRAIVVADELADLLLTLGHEPQSSIVREIREALYHDRLDRAIEDLAKR